MKQLGNLAIVCAGRPEILLQIYSGHACVYVGKGPERAYMVAEWDDDEAISSIIHALNYGKYAQKERMYSKIKRVPLRVLQQKCPVGI